MWTPLAYRDVPFTQPLAHLIIVGGVPDALYYRVPALACDKNHRKDGKSFFGRLSLTKVHGVSCQYRRMRAGRVARCATNISSARPRSSVMVVLSVADVGVLGRDDVIAERGSRSYE